MKAGSPLGGFDKALRFLHRLAESRARTISGGALIALAGSIALAQTPSQPSASLPNPFGAPILDWSRLPSGSEGGGHVAGIEVGPRGEIWAIGRCGTSSCDQSNLAFVNLLDIATGKPVRSIGAGLFVFPHGLHIDREGNVWITDAASSKDGTKGQQVVKLSPEGRVLMRLGTAGIAGGGPDHFQEPSDVITAPNGDIFVADGHSGQASTAPADYVTRIVKFSGDGKFIKQWGKLGSGPGEFRNPHALAMDSRGRLFVADRGNARIQIFDQDGKFLSEWPQFGRPSGITIKDDTLYVIDADSGPANHPGWPKGIWIGSAQDGHITGFVPDNQDSEGIVLDMAGNAYGAVNAAPLGITKYPKR